MRRSFREESKLILGFVGLLWLVYLIDLVLPVDLRSFGLTPRTVSGIPGIGTMPFLHVGWNHLISNTVPLVVLLFLLAGSRAKSVEAVVGLIVTGGVLLWCFGRSGSIHIGASGLIYGLIAFLIVAGFRERHFVSLAVAILTGFLYGGTLLFGILPTAGEKVSWDGHLAGAVAGVLVAVRLVKKSN